MFIAKRYESCANKSSDGMPQSHKIFLLILGLTALNQLRFETLQKDFDRDEFGEDGECSLMPDGSAQSPECMEAHLFRSWQQEEAVKNDRTVPAESLPLVDMNSATAVLPDGSLEAYVAVAGAAKDAAARAAEQMRTQFAELSAEISASENEMQEHLEALPSIHRKMTEDKLAELGIQLDASEHEKELDDIYSKVTESLKSRSSFTDWDQSLVDMQAQLEKRHRDLEAKHHHSQSSKTQHHSSKLRGHHQASVSKELAKMDAKWDEAHKGAQTAHRAWEKNFSENMLAIGKKLCADPERRNTPACAAFASTDVVSQNAATQTHHQWEDNFTSATHSLVHQLCSDPRRRNYPVCQKENNASANDHALSDHAALNLTLTKDGQNEDSREAEGGSSHPASATALRGQSQQPETDKPRRALRGHSHSVHLQWSPVKAWRDAEEPHMRDRELVNIGHDKVQHVHWQGAIPKVGCITAVPSGAHARLQMRYFIENFNLQAYEGSKQLILVYHHTDHEAAELVKEYADGSYIKGVASRCEGTFPSTEALRFGAWSSDADVIAHWEFDEFHHSKRLSVQVRAMAMSSRPASILRETPQLPPPLDDDWGRIETLTGEAKWMRVNWSPLRHVEADMLKIHAHQVAQVEI